MATFLKISLASVLFLIVGLVGGYFLRGLIPAGSTSPTQTETVMTKPNVKGSTLFLSQNASIDGKVTKVTNRTLTIEDKNGQTAEFVADIPLSVSYFDPSLKPLDPKDQRPNDPNNDLRAIILGKNALITLTAKKDQEYKVTTIAYLPLPTTGTTPSSSPSARIARPSPSN